MKSKVSTLKDVSPDARLPVLIAIHGGAFVQGAGSDIGPDFLLNEADVVIVSVKEISYLISLIEVLYF